MMERYYDLFANSFRDYATYLWQEILHPHWSNYFYWLIAISLFVYSLELLFPWRRNQPALRRDFWLDGFYMFFNFFLFSLIGYAAISNIVGATLSWASRMWSNSQKDFGNKQYCLFLKQNNRLVISITCLQVSSSSILLSDRANEQI